MASKTPSNFEIFARLRPSEAKVSPPLVVNGDIAQQKDQSTAFRKIFKEDAPNAEVFRAAVQPSVERALQGFNSHVIFYGASSSGKSHTVVGQPENPGVVALAAQAMFRAAEESKKQKFLVTVSMYQIQSSFSKAKNREFVTDLINPDTSKTLTIAPFRDNVDGLAEVVCKSAEQIMTYVNQGWAVHRLLAQRAATEKGHVVVDLRVESTDRDDPFRVTYATLRFAVLAAAGGKAVEYNNGLKEFNNIVNARASNVADHEIQFQASKLTQVLQQSLSSVKANAGGVLLLCVNQAQDSADMLALSSKLQSLSTASKPNVNTITAAVRELREEIRSRRDALKLDNPTTYLQDIKTEHIQALQRLVVELERVKSQTWKCRRDNSAAVLRQRVTRLKAEGLAGVLAEATVDIPKEMRTDAKEKLRTLIGKHNLLRAQEEKVEAARHRYNTLAKKVKPDAAAGDKMKAQAEKQQQAFRQEELMMNKIVAQYNAAVADFTAAQRKILQLETKRSKNYLFPEDAAAVQRARDHELWAEAKAEREALLDGELAVQQQRAEALNKEVEAAADVESCKRLLAQLAEAVTSKEVRVKELEVDKDLITGLLYKKDAAHENQMQRFQEHMFFVFRNYRSHFEEQKTRIELRYRELLENAVKDALKLQEENSRLRSEMLKRASMT